jgi:antitoxin (DNA-binding transcriptional repressor) of toxin-antitoxin stability system
VIIAKAGRGVAKLVPLDGLPKAKKLGALKGKMTVPDDFNAPLEPGVIAAFEGRP